MPHIDARFVQHVEQAARTRAFAGFERHCREVTRRVSVRSINDEKVLLEVDGELVGMLPATFEILPRALRVRVKEES